MLFKSIERTYVLRKPSIFQSNLKFHDCIVGHRKYEINIYENEIEITRRTNSVIDFFWTYSFFWGVVAKGRTKETSRDVSLILKFQSKLWYRLSIMIYMLILIVIIFLTSPYSQVGILGVTFFTFILGLHILFSNFCLKKFYKNLSEDISSIN